MKRRNRLRVDESPKGRTTHGWAQVFVIGKRSRLRCSILRTFDFRTKLEVSRSLTLELGTSILRVFSYLNRERARHSWASTPVPFWEDRPSLRLWPTLYIVSFWSTTRRILSGFIVSPTNTIEARGEFSGRTRLVVVVDRVRPRQAR